MKKSVSVGNVIIGDSRFIPVQTMTNTDTRDVSATLAQIDRLSRAGADLVRVTVQDDEAALAFKEIVQGNEVPLIADIHFDARVAIKAIQAGAKKIRLNPGNTPLNVVRDIVKCATDYRVPIRVGVNRGSVKGEVTAEKMVDLCLATADKLEELGFYDLVLAVKSSDVRETIDAYRLLSTKTDHPLHLGLTEAGVGETARLQSAMALGALLVDDIGDTVRVSIAGDPAQEVYVARKILNYLGLRHDMPKVVACPTCGRTVIDVEGLATRVEKSVENIHKNIKIAVMGCIVNGLGEGRDADVGIAGGKDYSILFNKGERVKTVKNEDIEKELLKYVGEL